MKKLSMSLIAITMCMPAMAATDIASNASSANCTESVLDTTSGTSNLEAKWTANTLNIDWYNGDDKITSTTCTYDGGIVVPNEDPEKTGYTFNGWSIRRAAAAPQQQCSFSGLSDTIANGKEYGYTRLDGDTGYKEAMYDLTQGSGEWAVEFYHGIVRGQSMCSSVGPGQTDNPIDDLDLNGWTGAYYCWCKMTGYTPRPWTYDTGNASTSPIYLTGYTNQSKCRTAVMAITGLYATNANTLLNNASVENPQLITNATGANVAYLTDNGCTVSGATGHFGEMGNVCPITSSSWVFVYECDEGYDAECASDCANHCGSSVRQNVSVRAAMFGTVQ